MSDNPSPDRLDLLLRRWINGEYLTTLAGECGVSDRTLRRRFAIRCPDYVLRREAVRASAGVLYDQATQDRHAALGKAVTAWCEQQGVKVISCSDLMEVSGATYREFLILRRTLPGLSLVDDTKPGPDRMSDDAIIRALREVSQVASVPMTANEYESLRDRERHPSRALIAIRPGWAKAMKSAGLPVTRSLGVHRRDRLDDEHLTAALRYFLDIHPHATAPAYEEWARENPAAPSWSTVRNRMGKWTVAVQRALSFDSERAHELMNAR